MANENKPDRLEMEKIKLERLKVYGKIITVLISVGIGTFGVAYINHIIQAKRLEGQLKQEEMKYLGEFLNNALVDNHEKRLRFAEYFATLTISPELQQKWKDYRDGIINTIEELKNNKKEYTIAIETGETEKAKEIKTEIDLKQAQLSALPEKIFRKDSGDILDEYYKPKNYIDNKFEVQQDGKVVCDKATGLMWQQSGSDDPLNYNEVKAYIVQLNSGKYAGYSNWRLPTLKEAISILEPTKMNGELYIDKVFDETQEWIWTSDQYSASSAWVVSFDVGHCSYNAFAGDDYVRAVR